VEGDPFPDAGFLYRRPEHELYAAYTVPLPGLALKDPPLRPVAPVVFPQLFEEHFAEHHHAVALPLRGPQVDDHAAAVYVGQLQVDDFTNS